MECGVIGIEDIACYGKALLVLAETIYKSEICWTAKHVGKFNISTTTIITLSAGDHKSEKQAQKIVDAVNNFYHMLLGCWGEEYAQNILLDVLPKIKM